MSWRQLEILVRPFPLIGEPSRIAKNRSHLWAGRNSLRSKFRRQRTRWLRQQLRFFNGCRHHRCAFLSGRILSIGDPAPQHFPDSVGRFVVQSQMRSLFHYVEDGAKFRRSRVAKMGVHTITILLRAARLTGSGLEPGLALLIARMPWRIRIAACAPAPCR